MLRCYGPPAILLLLGLWGLIYNASIFAGDGDPQRYYLAAGKCLGRDSWCSTATQDPNDPLYRVAMLNGGKAFVHLNRMMPYRDFVCEYPPASLVTFIIPRLFTDRVVTYYWLFSLEMAIPAIGLWWLGIRIAQLLQPTRLVFTSVSAAWMFWVWASGRALLHRFDLVVVFLVALGTLCVLRRRWGWAGFWFGLGIAVKVYPVFLLLPACIIGFGDRRWKAVWQPLAGVVVMPLLSHLALLPFTGMSLFSYLSYHSARGVEVESIWAQLIVFFVNRGGDVIHAQELFGSEQLASTKDLHYWILASYASMFFTNILCAAIAYFRISRLPVHTVQWRIRVVALFLATIVFATISAKVLSIQYVFWLFPMAMLIPNRAGMAISVAYIFALAMGRLWFPDYWTAVSDLTGPGTILVFSRNLLLLAIAVMAAIIAIRIGIPEAAEHGSDAASDILTHK